MSVNDHLSTFYLTPHGRLCLRVSDEIPGAAPEFIRDMQESFTRGTGHGLLHLGGKGPGMTLPPLWAYWRDQGLNYITEVCTIPGPENPASMPEVKAPGDDYFKGRSAAAPVMSGSEYISPDLLKAFWKQTDTAFREELAGSGLAVPEFLKTFHPTWNMVGRVHFNLAENRKDESYPFAFMATYTPKLSVHGKVQHQPLGQSLKEYAGQKNKGNLLSLLLPVQRASGLCPWLKDMLDSGEIYHPLRWSLGETIQFLHDIPLLELSGVIVRMPAAWKAGRPSRPKVKATLGTKTPSGIGADALLDFSLEVVVDGETISAREVRELLAGSDGLALIRGRWVEVDKARLEKMLHTFHEVEKMATAKGIPFTEAMKMLSGFRSVDEPGSGSTGNQWSEVVAGSWMSKTLQALRAPEALSGLDPGRNIHGTLRPYQETGVRWLHMLTGLGLGACLADDMGLGKTLQVLSLLLVTKRATDKETSPSLLVAPASLLANWASEIAKFAPDIRFIIAHPSEMKPAALKHLKEEEITPNDLIITTYGSVMRLDWIGKTRWKLVILDEAQAIKNPDAKQTKAVKKLHCATRIALTGTPVENRLSDLWSIFDFINPGLLGSAHDFSAYAKRLEKIPDNPFAALRELVRPYILRRLKTDKRIIADLPDKTEIKAYCTLSKMQAALYQQSVKELEKQLKDIDGIKRKGIVLAFLMRLKQICNHPSQWLGDGAWDFSDSGKLSRLREIAEVIADKQEKTLVFTQFREMTTPLNAFLGSVFGREGIVLHGGTEVKKRKDLIKQFQEDEGVPYFVLSLKAGGSGLNLTAASHVIHFDRWWNPAVENQATDRAFRIGQTKNVLVHKFICKGTVEDKIDMLIESKKRLSEDLLEGGAESLLTEMTNDELLKLIALDLNSISGE